jgi:hypothetical protein
MFIMLIIFHRIWSLDCDGGVYGGLIGDAEFTFKVGPEDRSLRNWSLRTQRTTKGKYAKEVAFVMLSDSRDVMEARMIKNMAARME